MGETTVRKLFHDLPEKEFRALLATAQELTYPAGQQVFQEGDPGNGFYLVKAGEVTISVATSTGERMVFSKVSTGDFFGEMAVLDDLPRSASAHAERETVVYFFPRETVMDVLKQSHDLGWLFLQRFSARLREFDRQYIHKVLQAERLALVGRFAAAIVHDLKNPLAIIKLAAELSVRDTATLEIRQCEQRHINEQVKKITDLVDEIREFTAGTPTKGRLELVNYKAFVLPIVEEMRALAGMIVVDIALENDPPDLALMLDSRRLYRVFHNLIKNAIEAVPKGGLIRLRFKITATEVLTEIEDSGPGIAPQLLDQLFEPFATFGRLHGTGLGLYICRRIIEEHRGHITARNQPGGGAIFTFTLPRTEASQS